MKTHNIIYHPPDISINKSHRNPVIPIIYPQTNPIETL